jgi:hypothetical protein
VYDIAFAEQQLGKIGAICPVIPVIRATFAMDSPFSLHYLKINLRR